MIGALFISSNRRFHIISLLQVGMDGQIYGTIGTSPTQYIPIKLLDDSLRDIITLIEYNKNSNLSPFKEEPIRIDNSKTVLFTMTSNH